MPFGKNLLNQVRLLLSASTLFSSVFTTYKISQGNIDNSTLISIIFIFITGIITGSISYEGMGEIIQNRSKGILINIKNSILIALWIVGLVWGAFFISLVLYLIFLLYFK